LIRSKTSRYGIEEENATREEEGEMGPSGEACKVEREKNERV